MNVQTAAFNLVHDYPGGATALAPLLGKSASTLSHEVDPNYPTAKLGLADALKLTMLSKDRSVLNAFAMACHCMVLPLPACADGVDDDTFKGVTRMAREFAEVIGQISEVTADGRVSDNELRRVESEAAELVSAVQMVLTALRARNEAGKPKSEREGS
jgi:hypothetical protein